jgi:hypothetical protein
MKKRACLALVVVILLSVHKGNSAAYAQEVIPGKKVFKMINPETAAPAFKSAAEIENMTDEQLIKEVNKGNRFDVADFRLPDDFGVSLQDNESWQHAKLNSVSSITDAEKEAKSFASAQNTGGYTADYIGENDYYYEYRLKYTGDHDTENLISTRIIVYKESAMFCAFNNKTGYYSEIRALDGDSVLYLLDLDVFFDVYNWDSARIIRREFNETASEYIYTYYRVSITSGDWELNDRAVLEKIKCGIDKTTGVKKCHDDSTVLKTVEIRGTAKKLTGR